MRNSNERTVRVERYKGKRLEGGLIRRGTRETVELCNFGPAILDDIEAVTSDNAALYFANRYGFLKPFQTWAPVQEFVYWGNLVGALRATIRSLMQGRTPPGKVLGRLKRAAPDAFHGKQPSVLRREIANFIASHVEECKMRPTIDWWANDGLWGIGWEQQDYRDARPLSFLTCSLAAIIVFLLDEMTGRTSDGKVRCGVCRRLFTPKRVQAGRRAFCEECRGSRAQWRLYKRPEGAAR